MFARIFLIELNDLKPIIGRMMSVITGAPAQRYFQIFHLPHDNGLFPLSVDIVHRGLVCATLIDRNLLLCATTGHDFLEKLQCCFLVALSTQYEINCVTDIPVLSSSLSRVSCVQVNAHQNNVQRKPQPLDIERLLSRN